MSHHPPFKQVEASRPDFDTTDAWKYTKTPKPDWVVGTGANAPQPDKFREIDPTTENKGALYKMMISAITPRPIGFISSYDAEGNTNLAPFSYFTMVAHDPPTVMVSFTHPSGDELKGTCDNILATKNFTANLISEHFVEAANYTSIDAPKGQSEWPLSGLTQVPSKTIKAPRVGESAFSMECELEHYYHLHNADQARTGTVVLGKVKLFHVRDDVIDDSLLVDTSKLKPVSRLGGISYGRTLSAYELPRPVWAKEAESDPVKKVLAHDGGKI
ncbi:hypothetical protein JCM1841_003973 [Sporobolomyces salmonicolor]